MADLLAQWLNEEVGLSKNISNFEDDFASGYLLGELLYKFNQQPDFQNFSVKNATSHFVMNFEKLAPTLRSLGVQFNSKTVERIMSRERGQSLRLLYQLKMVLEKVYPPADISIVAKTGTFGDNQPAQRIAMSKPKYDEVSHTFFKQRLGKLNRAQKDIDLEAHQMKFEEEMQRQATMAEKADKQDVVNDANNKQEMRRIQINKLQRNGGFMEEWLAKGVDDWKDNMTIKRAREAAQLEFDFTQAEKYNTVTQNKLQEAQDEVYDGIAAFEKNLQAKGISTAVTKEIADKAVNQTLSGKPWQSQSIAPTDQTLKKTFTAGQETKKGNFTLSSTGLKHRTKKTMTDSQRQEREKRRRRLINAQSTVLVDLEYHTREQHVTGLMKRQSRQEKELDYEAWRTTQCKSIIVENRKLRETQYERRREFDVELGIEKEQKLIAEMQDASVREMQQMLQRTDELKVYEKQHKLKQRTELCAGLMDTIFDIADEAYNHMQDLDAKQWEPTNWNNWLKLFVYKKNVAGTMQELLSEECVDTEAQTQLDDSEMKDYLGNNGQWPTTLVSEDKLNLADIMNPKVETAAPAKGKPASKATAQAEVVLEEGDLELSDTPANNFIFGDVIDQLVKLHYPQRPDLKHPPTPNWLALKVCLVGYPFSGKKTQAALIKEKYGLDVYVMDELIQECIDFTGETKYQQPAQACKVEDGEASDFGQISEDEILQKDVNEEMLAIGEAIREQLLEGQEISDALYVRLFICKLRCSYAYKCPVTKQREQKAKAKRYVDINKRIGEIAQEMQKEDLPKKQRKQLADEQAALEIELAEMDTLQTNGWVLVDFPCSYAQAKLLEEALSGFKTHEELETIEREKASEEALLLVRPHPQPEAPKTLIPSGLDAVIWLDCPVKEALRRSDGRRFDSQDLNAQYHVFDRQPPVDQAPLCERLLPLSEDNNCVSGLPDRFVAFDQTTASMQRWLKKFGDEEKNRILLTCLQAEKPVEEVQQQIQGSLELILEHRQERFENTRDDLALKIQTSIDNEKKQLELEIAKADMSQVSSNHQLSQARMSPSLSQSKSGEPGKNLNLKRGSQEQALGSVFTQESCVTTPVPFGRNNIEPEFRPTLIKMWHELSSNYCDQMKRIFRNVRRNREVSVKIRAGTQSKFLNFLHRLDNKQELLDTFVREFNQFSDDFPDLREDSNTKEELHQRCDVLSDELWEIVEERKEVNTDERKKIMESGTCENGLEFLTLCAQQLMQAELDKFKASIQIIHDYYFAIEEKPTHEITQTTTCELQFDGDDMPQVELMQEGADAALIQSYSYPKLDKLLQSALKNQAVPDVTAITTSSIADKKGKAPAKGKAAPKDDATETIQEESHYVKEMRESVKVEKSILRYRLVQIRNWTLGRLQHQRQAALDMYKKLDQWIQVAQKTEMDTIEEMCQVVKRAIEDESKMQLELRIKFMDFTVDQSVLNYINPPVPKLEALEAFSTDRFQIPQLHSLCSELQRVAQSTGDLIQIKELMALLLSKFRNSVCFGGNSSALPHSWNNFGQAEINQIVRNIDSKNTGYVNWRALITYMILLKSTVPSAKEISRIEKMLGNAEVDEETFVSGKFWFEADESSKDRDNAIPFERVKLIKGLLFMAHQTDSKLNVARFATVLGQISQRAHNEEATFENVLFSKVRI